MSSTVGRRRKRKAPSNDQKNTKTVAKKPRKPKGMPDFKPGEVVVDLLKKSWRLGELIGWGGFGALYYASSNTDDAVDSNAVFVAKVEPHSNGPLFGELAFYQRAAKEDTINTWISSHKLKFLGVPAYIGSGCHESNGSKYRFMIMERFGEDVDQVFKSCGHVFHVQTVFTLAIRILDILEYIHTQGYVHADIKGSNLMLGYKANRKNKIFLVDYGLACRYVSDNNHKEYKEDPKRRHDGTIEFTSRDAHKGVAPSRRTDLEILGYVMLKWLCNVLPWENKLNDKEYVMNAKTRFMETIPGSIRKCLEDQPTGAIDELEKYFKYVVHLDYEATPDYGNIRKIFHNGLRKRKLEDDGQTVTFKTADSLSHDAVKKSADCSDTEESKMISKSSGRNTRGRKPQSKSSNKEQASHSKAMLNQLNGDNTASSRHSVRQNACKSNETPANLTSGDEVIKTRSARTRKQVTDENDGSKPRKRGRPKKVEAE